MRNRVVLVSLTVLVWMALKAIDKFFTGPEVLIILCGIVSMMFGHSVWLFTAQLKHRKQVLARHSFAEAVPGAPWHPWVDICISAKNESRN